MAISMAQYKSVRIGNGGLLIWMWDPGIHLIDRLLQILIMINRVVTVIGLFQFWNVMRDVETHSIWRNKFSLSILPRIESSNGFANFDFTEMPLQDMIHGSMFISFRHFNLGIQERRM
jgi:hypothetical protein